MSKIILYILFSFLLINNISSQPEVFINNFSSDSTKRIKVKIYPISMVFNGEYEYNLRARWPIVSGNSQYYYIAGVSTIFNPNLHNSIEYIIDQDTLLRLLANHDMNSINASCNFAFGFGKYLIQFWWDSLDGPPSDYVTLEYDAGYRLPPITNADVTISYVDNGNDPRIEFVWTGDTVVRNTRDVQRKLECWNQYGRGTRPKNYGDFRFGFGSVNCQNNYTIIPQDPRRDCVPEVYPQFQAEQNHIFNSFDTVNGFIQLGPSEIGKLTLKLSIDKSITTPTFYNRNPAPYVFDIHPSPIIIENGASLILTKGNDNSTNERRIVFKKYDTLNLNTQLEVNPYGTLELQGSTNSGEKAHIYFESYSYTIIRQNGNLIMGQNSAIDLQGNSYMKFQGNAKIYQYPGSIINIRNTSTLMNCGAQFPASDTCVYALYNNGRYLISNICPEDYNDNNETIIENGTSFELYDSSRIEIEDNCKMIFSGENTYLKAVPGTSIILGAGASIEFRNGAYLDADGCTFTSENSGEI